MLAAAAFGGLAQALPYERQAADLGGDSPSPDQLHGFLSQFMAAGSLPSKPEAGDAVAAAQEPTTQSKETPPEPVSKRGYGDRKKKHSKHHGDGYDDDHHEGGHDRYGSHGYHDDDEDDEEPYYQASLDCRFRVYPYASNPDECSEVKFKDYEPDYAYDNPYKTEAKGYCYWDFHRAKVDHGGACLCPRPKKECKEKKKQCYWHAYPNVGEVHEDKRKTSGYHDKNHKHKNEKSSGVCIHNSERFYNLMAKLLAKRGKKDLSLKIHYSSAPARGKLPYGPHGPAIIGFGQDFAQRHGDRYIPETYREENGRYGRRTPNFYGHESSHHGYGYESDHYGYKSDHYGYESDHYGYESDHYGYESDHYGYEPDHYGHDLPVYGGVYPDYAYSEEYLPHPSAYRFEHVAGPAVGYPPLPEHGYEDDEYGFEPSYHNRPHEYFPLPEIRWPMSYPDYHGEPDDRFETYFAEPEVELGSLYPEPFYGESPWPSPMLHSPYRYPMIMPHYPQPQHQCPPVHAAPSYATSQPSHQEAPAAVATYHQQTYPVGDQKVYHPAPIPYQRQHPTAAAGHHKQGGQGYSARPTPSPYQQQPQPSQVYPSSQDNRPPGPKHPQQSTYPSL